MVYARRALIVVEYETREKMKDAATKRQTYDQLINELLKLKEKEQKEKSRSR